MQRVGTISPKQSHYGPGVVRAAGCTNYTNPDKVLLTVLPTTDSVTAVYAANIRAKRRLQGHDVPRPAVARPAPEQHTAPDQQATMSTDSQSAKAATRKGPQGTYAGDAGNELMQALQQGRSDALGKLFSLYNGRLFNFIVRIVGDTATAEDIVQETWMTLYEHRDDYQASHRFSTWLFTVARRKALSELRRRSVRNGVRSLFWPGGGSEADSGTGFPAEPNIPQSTYTQPDVSADEVFLRGMVERALATLSKPQREIILLRDVEGFENEEIAGVLGWQIKPGAVRKRIFDAREAFRKAMIAQGYLERE